MITGRQSVLPAGGRATFRSKSLVLLGTLLILSSMFAYVASRPASVFAVSSVDYFTIGAISDVTAGDTIPDVTITAFDSADVEVADYDWSNAQVSSDLGDAPNATGTKSDGSLQPVVGASTTLSGAIGYETATGRTITITDTSGDAVDSSEPFDVTPGDVASFTFSSIADVTAGDTIPAVTLTAHDAYGNIATNYDFSAAGTTSNLGDAPNASGTASAGSLVDLGSGTAGLSGAVGYKAEPGRTLTVTDPGFSASGTSDPFTVKS